MSDIQGEAYNAIAEIRGLRARIENMAKNQAEGLRKRDAEIERLRNEIVILQRNEFYMEELAIRAADALEYWNDLPESRAKFLTLIAELRKAAE
jgi:hypothetical protein